VFHQEFAAVEKDSDVIVKPISLRIMKVPWTPPPGYETTTRHHVVTTTQQNLPSSLPGTKLDAGEFIKAIFDDATRHVVPER
jgi:hypothetical protein